MENFIKLKVCLAIISLLVSASCGEEKTSQERYEEELVSNCKDMVEDCFEYIKEGKLDEASEFTLSGSTPSMLEDLYGYEIGSIAVELISEDSALVEVTIKSGDAELQQEYSCVTRNSEWKLILE